MKRKSVVWILLLLSAVGSASGADMEAARQSLKNYGLAYCIDDRFPDPSDIKEDLGFAISIYAFTGAGMHAITQNVDTLEMLHNPYDATTDYIDSVYDNVAGVSKSTGKKIVWYACLHIFGSKEFDDFIKTQDEYIEHQ